MKIALSHRPAYALGIVDLAAGESVKAETGPMASMPADVQVESAMQGGIFKSALRKMLGGESFFVNTFTAQGAPGHVSFAPSLPGDVVEHDVKGDIYLQSSSYLAGHPGVDIDIKWGGARSFFASEGLFLLHLKGSGPVLMSSFGAIRKVDLDGSQSVVIDTGHIVAFDSSLEWKVRKVAGLLTS